MTTSRSYHEPVAGAQCTSHNLAHGQCGRRLWLGNASIIFVAITITLRRSISFCLQSFLDLIHTCNVSPGSQTRRRTGLAQQRSIAEISHHRTSTRKITKLEELGCEMDLGRCSGLLLQHEQCFRRGAIL
jgi:hypothetical protein